VLRREIEDLKVNKNLIITDRDSLILRNRESINHLLTEKMQTITLILGVKEKLDFAETFGWDEIDLSAFDGDEYKYKNFLELKQESL
jgi:hypothetical protein